MNDKIKVALLQTKVVKEKEKNLEHLAELMERLAPEVADLYTLPEMFNCPYSARLFPVNAESDGGETWRFCSELAKKHRVYLSAGSIPERGSDGRIYNTAYVFDREGKEIAKHRKAHLFDISITGGQQFKESDTLCAGNEITVFETEFCAMGLCVCYDLRFPELCRAMVDKGAKVILVPAAFNMTTGPAHWELLFRQRAVDNQVFMVGTAPARGDRGYISWGHSIAADPWGNVLLQMDDKENAAVAELDLSELERIRRELPLLAHRRRDLY